MFRHSIVTYGSGDAKSDSCQQQKHQYTELLNNRIFTTFNIMLFHYGSHRGDL